MATMNLTFNNMENFQLITEFIILIIAYRQTDTNDKTIYSIPLR